MKTNQSLLALLNELDKTEMRDIARRVKPDMTDEEFERYWAAFCAAKRAKEQQ